MACSRHAVQVVTPASIATVDELCASHPLAPDAEVRADVIARSTGASIHFVQIRGAEKPHRHVEHDLSVTLLRGEGVLRLGGSTRVLHAGDVVAVPRGVPHWFTRTGADVAVSLAVYSPPLDAPDTVPVDVDSPASAR